MGNWVIYILAQVYSGWILVQQIYQSIWSCYEDVYVVKLKKVV